MNKEATKRAQPMPLSKFYEIEKRIKNLGEKGVPSLIPGRLVSDTIARKIAHTMAYHPDIPDASYLTELMCESIPRSTARRIIKRARAFACGIEVPSLITAPVASNPQEVSTPSSSVGERGKKEGEGARAAGAAGVEAARTAGAAGAEVAGADADGVLTEYVRKLPDTLPKPIRNIPVEYNVKERKKVSLASLRPDIFDREFEKSLRSLAPVTPGNAFGRYDPNPDLDKYPHTWDAVGNYHVPPNILAECLPYMAEEGLLEFHKVPLRAVQELEELRQLYIKKGMIGEYDRNVRPNSRNQVQSDPIDK
jgi:hypothetical protein